MKNIQKCAVIFSGFQLLYAAEGESKKPEDKEQAGAQDRSGVIEYKGHDFIAITFRMPTYCESCTKPVYHMIHPPMALECMSKKDSHIIIMCNPLVAIRHFI